MSTSSYLTLLALEDQLRHDRRVRDHWIAGYRGHRPAVTSPTPVPVRHRHRRATAALASLVLAVAPATSLALAA